MKDRSGKNLKSWEEFLEQLEELEKKFTKGNSSPEFLYRGHERKGYRLETTLERYIKRCISLREYYELIIRAKPKIESYTNKTWNIPEYDEYVELLKTNKLGFPKLFADPINCYMMHLRHYGFPSPILDWSSSSDVAAYFAFKNVLQCEERVSIFVYLEMLLEEYKVIGDNYTKISKPWIYSIYTPEPCETEKRPVAQQSVYTICVVRDKAPDSEWMYAPHGKVFARKSKKQDVLWKFNIPYSERLKVLKLLDNKNINAWKLLEPSEDSFMETMALREIYFK